MMGHVNYFKTPFALRLAPFSRHAKAGLAQGDWCFFNLKQLKEKVILSRGDPFGKQVSPDEIGMNASKDERCARHFLKAQLHEFGTDFIEKLEIRMLFARPRFRHGRFNVVLLQGCGVPFSRDYVLRSKLCYDLSSFNRFG